MTQTEALKLALKALEYEAQKGNDNAYQSEREAIKAALEAKDEPWKPDDMAYRPNGLPQRPWVGLTDEEAAECWTYNDRTSWRNIEAKLKEKNT
jgi:hypothetical protein